MLTKKRVKIKSLALDTIPQSDYPIISYIKYDTQGTNTVESISNIDLTPYVYLLLEMNYTEWTALIPSFYYEIAGTTDAKAFDTFYKEWLSLKSREYSRIASGLYSDFSPLENFDRKEVYTDGESHSGSISTTKTIEGTETNTREYEDATGSQDEYSKSGQEISELALDTIDTDKHENTTTLTHNTTDTDIHSNTDTLTFTGRTKTHLESAFNDTADTFRNKSRDVDSGTETHTISSAPLGNTLQKTGTDTTVEASPEAGNTFERGGTETTTNSFDNYKETTAYKKHYTDTNERSFDNYEEVETTDLSGDVRTLEHDGSLHGNIGVTQSVDMIRNEIDLRIKNTLSKIILDDFMNECSILEWDPSEIF